MMSNSGTKWSTEEEVQLCTSWVTISSCGVTGKDQDVKKLWRNIHDHYVQHWQGDPENIRTQQALESRWKNLKKCLASWHDALTKAAHFHESGKNMMDEVSVFCV